MKKQQILIALGAMFLASCADTWDREYSGINPQKEGYEYLAEYLPLKEYVDRSAYPNFKLGIATSVSDYNQQQLVYALVNSNADETVAGNAMKMASCVDDKGNMSFDNAVTFVNSATDAGLNVYGHTLAWHAQQPNKFLNGLLKDKEIEVDPSAANNFIKYNCGDPGANSWDKQAIYTLPIALEKDADYTLKVDIKAEGAGVCGLWPIWDASPNKNQWGGSNDVQYLNEVNVGPDWTTCQWKFKASFTHDKLQFVFGLMGGFICFDNLILVKDGTEENLISNGDFAEASASGWANNWGGPSFAIEKEAGAGVEVAVEVERTCIIVRSGDMAEAAWDTQFWLVTDTPFGEGDSWSVSMSVRADKVATSSTQVHKDPGAYLHWAAIGTVSFTKDWETYSASGTIDASQAGGYSIAFNLNDFAEANNYYFDDISFKLNGKELITNGNCDDPNGTANFIAKENRGSIVPATIVDRFTMMQEGNTIPLTPEEKKDTLTWAMDRWIGGMMEAMQGKVYAWDAVNEPISGTDSDGDGIYELWSADNGDASNNFYWQDYLGSEDYVRIVIAKAREHYQGSEPLKLFVNDYNLESDWDDNKKLKSLIHWINVWEADGVTKIDGIGSQMHISCYADPVTQASKEEHVVKMLELMAETGKLVRISELDMGYVDETGNSVTTANMTEAQHKAMSDYYKFIVSKYLEIIPASQQWGICQWCITDSPADSGWRANEPVGLWNSNYNRKHTYAGWADGLVGK